MTIIHIMKIITDIIKKIKKLDRWSKSVLFLSTILISIIIINKYKEPIALEGFTQNKKYVLKRGDDIYDGFYCDIYDDLVLDDVKNKFEVEEISRITQLSGKKSILLDVGCGTGRHMKEFSNLGINVHGIDKSASMITMAKKNCPEGKYKTRDVLDQSSYNNDKFTHSTCLYFTVYYIKNKLGLFKNIYSWLKPGGVLVLHLVNREKFNPIVNAGDPLTMVSAQKFAKERITNTVVKFKDFKYKSNFKFIREENKAFFEENMKDDITKNIRANKHELHMDTQKKILSLAKSVGFILKGKVDMVHCMYEYQYLYMLYKPN